MREGRKLILAKLYFSMLNFHAATGCSKYGGLYCTVLGTYEGKGLNDRNEINSKCRAMW